MRKIRVSLLQEIPTTVKDEHQEGVDEKTQEKMEDVSNLLVSYQIGDKKEIEMILALLS